MRDEAELSYVVRSHSIFGMEIPRSKSYLIDVAHLRTNKFVKGRPT